MPIVQDIGVMFFVVPNYVYCRATVPIVQDFGVTLQSSNELILGGWAETNEQADGRVDGRRMDGYCFSEIRNY